MPSFNLFFPPCYICFSMKNYTCVISFIIQIIYYSTRGFLLEKNGHHLSNYLFEYYPITKLGLQFWTETAPGNPDVWSPYLASIPPTCGGPGTLITLPLPLLIFSSVLSSDSHSILRPFLWFCF